ncbi:MAG: hypothetical protein JTJ21_09910 [Holdemanella sp.]|nr:hypothetical protein [Holdemanella sp.]
MKNELIKVRIDPDLKIKYKQKLDEKNVSMSQDILNHIYTVIDSTVVTRTNSNKLYREMCTIYDILKNINFNGRDEVLKALGEIEDVIY